MSFFHKRLKADDLLFTLIALMFIGCAEQNHDAANVKLTVLNSMERIGQQQALFGDSHVSLKAARNEVESFQVVVHADKSDILVVNAEMSELSGPGGTIAADNASVFREEYTRVRLSSPRASLPPGLYADPLVPLINPETRMPIEPRSQTREGRGGPVITKGFEVYGVPFKVWKDQNQPLWIDISVPKEIAPGEYNGTFTVTVSDQTDDNIPKNDGVLYPGGGDKEDSNLDNKYLINVTLVVWDFALPDGPTHRNHFGSVERAANAFQLEPDSEEFRKIELNYCRMMADNRINPPIPESFLPEVNDDGSLEITMQTTQKLKEFIRDYHVTDFPVPPAPFRNVLTSDRDKAIRYYGEWYRYLKDNDWQDRAYLYMLDEPNDKQSYEEVLALGKLVSEGAAELRRLVVEQPYPQDSTWPDINPAVDIWCPLFSFIDPDRVSERMEEGDEVWSYTALAQRAPGYSPSYQEVKDLDPPYWAIDQPLTSYRIPTWINWRYGIKGYLYWTTVYSDRSVTGVMDPWFLPIYAASGKHFSGEGYLIYPGKPCGIDGPVASIRLKNMRDGMEDYEYFDILQRLSKDAPVTDLVSGIVPNWWAKPSAKDFLSVREKIAARIVELKK